MVTFNHPGPLCKIIREARTSINIKEMAKVCGYKSKTDLAESIRNFENGTSDMPEERFWKYIDHLNLLPNARQNLLKLYEGHSRRLEEEERLGHYSFAYIQERRFPELIKLTDELKSSDLPTLIVDELLYVHAVNSGMLELYQLTEEYLQRPEAWHAIIIKYQPDQSHPILQAHGDHKDAFFSYEIGRFFNLTSQLFFTSQFQNLVKFACQFSPNWFAVDWQDLLLMRRIPQELPTTRSFCYQGENTMFKMKRNEVVRIIPVVGQRHLNYYFIQWQPMGRNAAAISQQIKRHKARYPSPVFFASDYVHNYTEHDWCKLLVKD